mmetsp:Transcript_62049/g.200066  ORF Transcript_62049/g.200066 Transcript_62049/m.200066 type:complete len:344 (+) Transcript_62049:362-1393(+)
MVDPGNEMNPVQELHQRVDREPEVGLLLQQRPLALVDARILVQDHLEAGSLDGRLEDVRVARVHATQNRLVDVFHPLVFGVVLIERVAHDVVLKRNLGAWLHHAVHLAEESREVRRIAQDLDVVGCVQAVVGKRQAVVVVCNLKIQLLPQSRLVSVLPGQPDLLLIHIQASDMCPRVRGHVVGNSATATANVHHLGTVLDLQVIGHLLLIESLVLVDVLARVQVWRQVHLLKISYGAQVVQNAVIVSQQIYLTRLAYELVLFEHLVRLQEALEFFLGHGCDCADRSDGRSDSIPHVFPLAAHVRHEDDWHREHYGNSLHHGLSLSSCGETWSQLKEHPSEMIR